jgi:hypothetical protein
MQKPMLSVDFIADDAESFEADFLVTPEKE